MNADGAEKAVHALVTVSGQVQQVGFRRRVGMLAKGMGLKGYVENLRQPGLDDPLKQPVRIVCQGDRESIEFFASSVLKNIKNQHIRIGKVEIEYLDDPGMDFQDFYILRGELQEELGPRIDTAVGILKNMDRGIADLGDKIDGGFETTNGNFWSLDGKYHTVSEDLKAIRSVLERRLEIEEERESYTVERKEAASS